MRADLADARRHRVRERDELPPADEHHARLFDVSLDATLDLDVSVTRSERDVSVCRLDPDVPPRTELVFRERPGDRLDGRRQRPMCHFDVHCCFSF